MAGIAIGISLISAPGLYALMNIPIGLVLLATLHAVDSRKDDNRFQSASFAIAWALTFLLIVGLFLVNPYLTDNHGIFTPVDGRLAPDPFTHIEIPAIGWIKDTFKDGALDIVSFAIVSIVAIIWFALRRRFFAVHQKPPQPQDEDKGTPSSKSSTQLASTAVQAGKGQEPATQTGIASSFLASEAGQYRKKQDSRMRVKERMTLGVFSATMVLLAYILCRRESKNI